MAYPLLYTHSRFTHTIHLPDLPSLELELNRSISLLKHARALMSSNSKERLHALQHLPLQILPCDILPGKPTIRRVELKRLERLPNTVDLGWWQGDHVRIGPHEAERRGAGVFV